MNNFDFSNDVAKSYLDYIESSTKMSNIMENHIEINTPFLDSNGESISFSIYKENEYYKLSDDGFTIWELNINGIDVKQSGNRQIIFDSNIKYSGFDLDENNNISKTVSKKDLGQSIHEMSQLLINLYDLTYLHRNTISNQYFIDVKNYFEDNNDKYIFLPDFNITGKSQLNHKFEYVFIQRNERKFTKVEKNISKNKFDSILSGWLDTYEMRRKKYNDTEELYIILSNEGYINLKSDIKLALNQYNIRVLNFSDKNEVSKHLSMVS